MSQGQAPTTGQIPKVIDRNTQIPTILSSNTSHQWTNTAAPTPAKATQIQTPSELRRQSGRNNPTWSEQSQRHQRNQNQKVTRPTRLLPLPPILKPPIPQSSQQYREKSK